MSSCLIIIFLLLKSGQIQYPDGFILYVHSYHNTKLNIDLKLQMSLHVYNDPYRCNSTEKQVDSNW